MKPQRFTLKTILAMQYSVKLGKVLLLGKLRNDRLKLEIYNGISSLSGRQEEKEVVIIVTLKKKVAWRPSGKDRYLKHNKASICQLKCV